MNFKFANGLLLALVLFLPCQLTMGQSREPVAQLSKGEKIRLRVTPNSVLEGTLVAVQPKGLAIRMGEREVTIPANQIQRLEVANGVKKNTGKGAAIGALTGGLGLGLLGAIAVSGDQDGWIEITPGQAFLGGLIGGGLLGGITGALIGSGHNSTNWEMVPLERVPVRKKTLQFHTKAAPPVKDSTSVRIQKKHDEAGKY